MQRIQKVGAILLSAVVLGYILLALADKDAQNWNNYMAEHHCQLTGRARLGRFRENKIYRCDGGEIIVR